MASCYQLIVHLILGMIELYLGEVIVCQTFFLQIGIEWGNTLPVEPELWEISFYVCTLPCSFDIILESTVSSLLFLFRFSGFPSVFVEAAR